MFYFFTFYICLYLSVFLQYYGFYTGSCVVSFSKLLCKALLAISNYEVVLLLYFSLSLFVFFQAKCELLSLHVYTMLNKYMREGHQMPSLEN